MIVSGPVSNPELSNPTSVHGEVQIPGLVPVNLSLV